MMKWIRLFNRNTDLKSLSWGPMIVDDADPDHIWLYIRTHKGVLRCQVEEAVDPFEAKDDQK